MGPAFSIRFTKKETQKLIPISTKHSYYGLKLNGNHLMNLSILHAHKQICFQTCWGHIFSSLRISVNLTTSEKRNKIFPQFSIVRQFYQAFDHISISNWTTLSGTANSWHCIPTHNFLTPIQKKLAIKVWFNYIMSHHEEWFKDRLIATWHYRTPI